MRVLSNAETVELLAENLALFEADMGTGTINWASRVLERMFGYKVPGDLEGRPIEILIPDELQERHAKEHRLAFAANPEPRLMGRKLSLSGKRQDGTIFPVEVILLPRASNRLRVVVGVVIDLSDRSVAQKVPFSGQG